MSEQAFDGWAILEVMGHRRLAGRVTEVQLAGAGFLRIDVIGGDGPDATQFYPPSSVYCLTPVTEEAAYAAAAHIWTRPAQLVGLPAPARIDDEPFIDHDDNDLPYES